MSKHTDRNHLSLIRSLLLISTAGVLSTNCGSSSNKERPVSQSQRTGRANSSVDAKYIDSSPSVSGDGTKVIFTSGRDDGISRIFKSTWSGSAWSAPVRLSGNTGMTGENIAKISPNGNYALIQGFTASGEILSLCVIADGSCTTVSSSPWGLGEFEFSRDSSRFFYLSGDKSTGANLFVGDVNTGVPTSSQTTGSNTWIKAFWSTENGAPYTLIAAKKSTTIGKMTLTKRTFNDASGAAGASASDIGTDISYGTTLDPNSASVDRFTVTIPIKASTSNTFTELGTEDSTKKKTIPIRNELRTWLAAGTDEGTVSATTGFETAYAWISSDNTSIFTLNRIAVRCAGDSDSTWGFGIARITRADNSVAWYHLKKPADLDQGPVVVTDPCDRTLNGAATTLDFGASELRINASANASAHTMVWTSDMSGDPEIFASITSAGSTTSFNISKNRKP